MRLPLHLRKRIYRFAVLPADRKLHPYIKSWYDQTTQNAVPLIFSCRQVYHESEEVLYGESIFCSTHYTHNDSLQEFFVSLPRRLRSMIRFLEVLDRSEKSFKLLSYAECNLSLSNYWFALDFIRTH